MSLHPKAAHWFETFVPRQQTLYALEALAATGQVELEQGYVDAPLLDSRQLRARMVQFQRLVSRYATLLPTVQPPHTIVSDAPEHTADQALACLRSWLARQLRLQRRLSAGKDRLHQLRLLGECLEAMGDASESLLDFGQQSPFLYKCIYACPNVSGDKVGDDTPGIAETYVGPRHTFHVVVCLSDSAEARQYPARMGHCKILRFPPDLVNPPSLQRRRMEQEISQINAELATLELQIADARSDPRLAGALSDMAVLRWYLDHTVTLAADRKHCRLTGWTSAADPEVLHRALRNADIDATIVFRPAPPDRPPPVDTRSTSPFRIFVNMFGIPGSQEVDPTPLLAILVPALFGFMFSDLGQGLVLAAAALALSFRYPSLRFLVPCGLAAAGFGILFGETFGSRDIVPAVWLHPMDHPLTVLLAPLGLGVAIILLGLVLSAIEARWRGQLRHWLWLDGAVLMLYASGLIGLFHPAALLLTGVAVGHYLVGSLVTCQGRRWTCLARDIGRLLHSVFELALNTFSFLRVGAFALAHVALTEALLEITALIDQPFWQIVFQVLGHGLLILIESLVVFVQTTRLVLFEFFTRFLRADGRLFRPLRTPDSPPDR